MELGWPGSEKFITFTAYYLRRVMFSIKYLEVPFKWFLTTLIAFKYHRNVGLVDPLSLNQINELKNCVKTTTLG